MPDQRQAKRDVFVLDGTFGLVGRLDGLHIDPDGEAWGTVHCGTFGARTRLVPLRGAQWWSGYLRVTCSRHQVRTAPEYRVGKPVVILGALSNVPSLPSKSSTSPGWLAN